MSDIPLKEYFDRRIEDFDKRINERFESVDAGIGKAERTMNERLNSMNEFRDALRDAQARMATRLEMDKIDEAVRELQRAKANFDGRLVILSGGISVVVSVVLWALTHVLKQ